MKTEFQAKFLSHLVQKKKEEGFTLIELLVVIIIIGILSAIALPSFLNQANKAKQSEAKTYVGALNKGQQAYYTEKSSFGTNVGSLGVGINTTTVNYEYSSNGTNGATFADSKAVSKAKSNVAALRGYAGYVGLTQDSTTSDVTSVAILCESQSPGTTAPSDPTNATACASGQNQVGK